MLWIANSYFDQKQCKNHLDRFVYCKTAVCGLLNYFWIIVITCLDSRSDGTHSLQRIHWWVSDVMQNFSKYVQMKKKQSHLHLGWHGDEYIFSYFSVENDWLDLSVTKLKLCFVLFKVSPLILTIYCYLIFIMCLERGVFLLQLMRFYPTLLYFIRLCSSWETSTMPYQASYRNVNCCLRLFHISL